MGRRETLNNGNGRTIRMAGNGNPYHEGFRGVDETWYFDRDFQIYRQRNPIEIPGEMVIKEEWVREESNL